MKKLLPLLCAVALLGTPLGAQCPAISNCPTTALEICGFSNNNAQFWNAPYWWYNLIQSHDLVEAPVDLAITATDVCFTSGLSFRYQLFLDLDGDGTQETVVDSQTPTLAGGVRYGNALNPNFSGGTFREFDQRPVGPLQKYRFGLQTSGNSHVKTARVRWRTDGFSANYTLPQLPYGTHRIKWFVKDGLGNQQSCQYSFVVKDCQKPVVSCLNGFAANIMPTGMLTVWASDFLAYAQDNATPANQLKYGVRKAGTGTGFPVDGQGNPVTSVTFDCDELGTQNVELWALDLAGNADYCLTHIIMQDNLSNCSNNGSHPLICAKSVCNSIAIDDMVYDLSGSANGVPVFHFTSLSQNGCANFNAIPWSSNSTITPHKDDNPLNGVSQWDGAKILAHINGTEPFTESWQWVAADANRDNVVDTMDIVECSKLILGIYTDLPNNTSWRFYPEGYVFPAGNPLSAPFPESIILSQLMNMDTQIYFIGVKVCDVSCSSLPNLTGNVPEEREITVPLIRPTVLPAQPNPTTAGAVIPVYLPEAARLRLEVFDLSGRIAYLVDHQMLKGEGVLPVPASAFPQAGLYVWRVTVGKEVFEGKILRD